MAERIDNETGEVTNALAYPGAVADPVAALVYQVQTVQSAMAAVMKEGEHFGVIPGTPKPTLYKSGAEKLNLLFRLAPRYDLLAEHRYGEHLYVRYKCGLYHIQTGLLWGEGIGSCSTKETKYRYRPGFEVTDLPIPKDAKDKKAEYRKQGFGMKKIDNEWKWVKFGADDRQENPDLADTYNTVEKMACKRALVAATLNATAASDIFTQDLEDTREVREPDNRGKEGPKPPGAQGRAQSRQGGGSGGGVASPGFKPSPLDGIEKEPLAPHPPGDAPLDRTGWSECPSCHGKGADGKPTVRHNEDGSTYCWKRAGGCGAKFSAKVWPTVDPAGTYDDAIEAAKNEADVKADTEQAMRGDEEPPPLTDDDFRGGR